MSKFEVKFEVNSLLVIPEESYPISETCEMKYILGYFVGSSFRKIGSYDRYDLAIEDMIDCQEKYKRRYIILKQIINIQKII